MRLVDEGVGGCDDLRDAQGLLVDHRVESVVGVGSVLHDTTGAVRFD